MYEKLYKEVLKKKMLVVILEKDVSKEPPSLQKLDKKSF